MSQHFLLSAAARSLSLAKVARMSDEEAHDAFKLIRWADTKASRFARAAVASTVYTYATRKLFKCKGLQAPIQRHVRDDLRQPQTADPRLPLGDRDLRQRREGP